MAAAVRLRNDFEHRFHSLDILHRAYACQDIYSQGPGRISGTALLDGHNDENRHLLPALRSNAL